MSGKWPLHLVDEEVTGDCKEHFFSQVVKMELRGQGYGTLIWNPLCARHYVSHLIS